MRIDNVPALSALGLALLALLSALVVPLFGCFACPLSGIAFVLALIAFTTTQPGDGGIGAGIAAIATSILAVSVTARSAWIDGDLADRQREQEEQRERAEGAVMRPMFEVVEWNDCRLVVRDAIASPDPEPDRHRIVVLLDVANQGRAPLEITPDRVSLDDAEGWSSHPVMKTAIVTPGAEISMPLEFLVPRTALDLVLDVRIGSSRRIQIEPREESGR